MKQDRPPLLERRLTLRMVMLQLITLLLFFGVGVFPFTVYPLVAELGNTRPLDPRVASTIADALAIGTDGRLAASPTRDLDELERQNPSIWFYVRDTQGRTLSRGAIPAIFVPIENHLDSIEVVEVRARSPDSGLSVLVRSVSSPIGTVQVMTGGGPTVGLANIVQAVSTILALATILILTLASVIVIPRLVRREMRGIKAAAAQAGEIDIDRRGTRLPTTDVPAEVQSLVNAVNGALTRLDDAYARRERFLADSAHELRTPIAILQTRLETADPFPGRAILMADVARLATLASQLLDLQRLDAEADAFVQTDLTELAGTVVGDLAPLAINGGHDLSLEAPDKPVMVRADIGSLSRALTNLVQNAMSHSETSGQIVVTVTSEGTLSVSDDGPGVPEAERQRIFEPFYRVTPSSRGAGLGLSLVADIVRRHGGTVSVDASPSGGARFSIALPLAGRG